MRADGNDDSGVWFLSTVFSNHESHTLCHLGLLDPSTSFAREPIAIYLAGDSTMAEKLPEKRPETGWGEKLQAHFDASKVRIENHAKNGRSTRTFLEEGRWAAIAQKL